VPSSSFSQPASPSGGSAMVRSASRNAGRYNLARLLPIAALTAAPPPSSTRRGPLDTDVREVVEVEDDEW
jgi:hypothetical protein